MVPEDDLKKSVQESVKNVTREVIGDIVYRITKASVKKAVKKLKEKAFDALKKRLKDVADEELESQLQDNVEQVAQAANEAGPEKADFTRTIQRGFERNFQKYLASRTPRAFPLKAVVIPCVSVIIVAGIALAIVLSGEEAPPPAPVPQPQPGPSVVAPPPGEPERPSEETPPPETPPPAPPEPEPVPETDLAVYNVGHELEGADIIISYEIANEGDTETGEVMVKLFLNEVDYAKDYAPPLLPHESVDRFFNLGALTGGLYSVSVCVDAEDWLIESNEDNNCREHGLEITFPEPDLTIKRVWHDTEGTDTLVFYEIANDGDADANEILISLFLNGKHYLNYILPSLPHRESVELLFNLGELGPGLYNVNICADNEGAIVESNESNNCFEHGWEQPQPPSYKYYLWRADSTIPPLMDERIRQAICITINEEYITEKYLSDIGGIFYPAENFAWEYEGQAWSCQDTDVEMAAQLLAEAGYPDGFPVTVAAAPVDDERLHAIVELVRESLIQLNIVFEYVEYFTSVDELPAHDYHLVFMSME